jgi:hypothetical protein
MSELERTAIREWALAAALRNPTKPKPTGPKDEPTPNVSFNDVLKTEEMTVYTERIDMHSFSAPNRAPKSGPALAEPEDSDAEHEEAEAPHLRAPLHIEAAEESKHWPIVPIATREFYGPLLPFPPQGQWQEVRTHFLGVLDNQLQEGLRYSGMSRTETADLLNLVARSRINAGAAAWHAHGKSHPSDPEGDHFEIPEPAKAARQRSLPTAMQPPTTGTALDMLGDDLVQDYTKYHNSTDPTKQPFTYGFRKPDAQTEAGRNKAVAKVTKVSSAADRTAFAKDIAHTRYRIGKSAYPTAGPM